jgi:hypothetical protein
LELKIGNGLSGILLLSFNLNPPPLVEDPERFDRSGLFF